MANTGELTLLCMQAQPYCDPRLTGPSGPWRVFHTCIVFTIWLTCFQAYLKKREVTDQNVTNVSKYCHARKSF